MDFGVDSVDSVWIVKNDYIIFTFNLTIVLTSVAETDNVAVKDLLTTTQSAS